MDGWELRLEKRHLPLCAEGGKFSRQVFVNEHQESLNGCGHGVHVNFFVPHIVLVDLLCAQLHIVHSSQLEKDLVVGIEGALLDDDLHQIQE